MATKTRVDFLIVEDFSMVGFLCALSAFKIANQVSGREHYETRIVAQDAEQVTTSVGISVVPDAGISDADRPDLVFVCAGLEPSRRYSKSIGAWLRRVERHGAAMAAISTGVDLLARAGLLDGFRCTIYWEQAAAFAAEFPNVHLTDRIFEIDRARMTCGGATSSIDLCLHLIRSDLGPEVSASVSSAFLLDRIRDAGELQKAAPAVGATRIPARLAKAIALMEANVEHPVSIDDVARCVGLGERQLHRLFVATLDHSPKQYYLMLRLARARMLVSQTHLSLQEIAMNCGFADPSNFARAYKRQFGASPSFDRKFRD
ncbi:MAG: GlxA family transcriptional regulator [Rhizobiaceae bacterium]|nr:GlxA family transcriptional regulator [Hyphomicrobiales bacterium]NRB32351.1 GlxA family transcriptional regulator [Rhizobiaceae bacterium]